MDLSSIINEGPSTLMWLVFCLFFVSGYYYYETSYNYWAKRRVKGERPFPLLGELYKILTKDRMDVEKQRVKKYGKVHGIFSLGSPRLVVADPEVLRQICIKDFDYFTNHQVNDWANKYERHFLVWLQGDYWKKVRSMMSPAFTSGKIKRMFKFLDACAEDLTANFKEQIQKQSEKVGGEQKGGAIVNLKELYEMFSMDGITTCGYGLKLHRENDTTNLKTMATRNDFVRHAQQSLKFSIFRLLNVILLPKFILNLIGFKIRSETNYDPIMKRVDKLIEKRRIESTKKYDDMLQHLIDAKFGDKMELNDIDLEENHHAGLTHGSLIRDQEKMVEDLNTNKENLSKSNDSVSEQNSLSKIEILSEALFLISAGLETTSILLTNCSYALAFHPEIQEKLYEELRKIVEFRADKDLYLFQYESLTSCQYLDAVISESLRILAPALQTDRVAQRDYYIEKYKIHVPKGSSIFLGIYAVQNDPDYWEQPEKFNPERFMPGNKENIVPGSYVPFSMGPRHCIGMRFSLTEAKIGLAKVMMKFKFEPISGTKFPPSSAPNVGLNFIKNPLVKIVPRDW